MNDFFVVCRSAAFLSELATNASQHGVPVVIYSGNDDSLVPHFGNEGTSFVLIIDPDFLQTGFLLFPLLVVIQVSHLI